jgi:hypothetical protein
MQQACTPEVRRRCSDAFLISKELPRQPQLGLWGGDGRGPPPPSSAAASLIPAPGLKILQSEVAPSFEGGDGKRLNHRMREGCTAATLPA